MWIGCWKSAIWEASLFATRRLLMIPSFRYRATLAGDPLYPLARTGPVVPAHAGNDREREGRRTRSIPRCALLRARHFCADPLALLRRALPDARWPTGPRAGRPPALRRARVPSLCRVAV